MREPSEDAARPATVGHRLRQARNRWFLGRDGELDLFRAALGAPQPPFAVLHVHGPGGVGKTALLRAFADAARAAGAVTVPLDARHFEPSPRQASPPPSGPRPAWRTPRTSGWRSARLPGDARHPRGQLNRPDPSCPGRLPSSRPGRHA